MGLKDLFLSIDILAELGEGPGKPKKLLAGTSF